MRLTRKQFNLILCEYFDIQFPKDKSVHEKTKLIADMFKLLTSPQSNRRSRKLDHEKTLAAAADISPSSNLITPIESLYQNIGMVLPYIEDLKARHMRMTNKHRRHQNLHTPHVQRALSTLKTLILTLEDYVCDMRSQIKDLVNFKSL